MLGELPDVRGALEIIRRRNVSAPDVALVLGSGLASLADAVEDPLVIATAELPGYPRSTVEGHYGRLVFGRLEGRPVAFLQGRVHYYEGHPVHSITFPVRLLHALGCRSLIVTNAAGGINPSFRPGTLMFITDHINLAFSNPLAGTELFGHGRLPGLCTPYDLAWVGRAEQAALEHGIDTRRGIYLWTSGPSYETKAEITAFARLGADAVGMSTVPEVTQARYFGMRVLGISTITNPAAGLGSTPLSHEEVLTVGLQVRGDLEYLIRAILREDAAR